MFYDAVALSASDPAGARSRRPHGFAQGMSLFAAFRDPFFRFFTKLTTQVQAQVSTSPNDMDVR